MSSPAYRACALAARAVPRTPTRICAALLALGVALAVLLATGVTPSAAATRVPQTSVTAKRFAHNMLIILNRERHTHGLRALTMSPRLIKSAHAHNLAMARANRMDHQLPHEAFFATRISHTGYRWRAVGENIGWNSRETNSGMAQLQHEMYTEKAPNDGHRQNILSRSYRQVGIDIYFDKTHRKMWFTQDFGQPA
jgi:uncharacterized protein YkwD